MTRKNKWSDRQEAIFALAADPAVSIIVSAVAGSGKTTTIVEAASRTPGSVGFAAFNKSIAEELAARLPPHVRALTLHSLGFRALMASGVRPKLDANKTRQIIRQSMTAEAAKIYGSGVRRLVALAKSHGIVPGEPGLLPDTPQAWMELIDTYDVAIDGKVPTEIGMSTLINLSRDVLKASNRMPQIIDFDDQLYMPVAGICGAVQPTYDTLFLDEAQDVNPVQRELASQSIRKGGRIIAVGDRHQAIYGFRGAGTNSIDEIKTKFNATELPLSISYRCPQAVVAEARKFVSEIEPSPDAPVGEVSTLDKYGPDVFPAGAAILCRNNAPLVAQAFRLLRCGVPVRILGRDFAENLISLVRRVSGRSESMPIAEFSAALRAYKDQEIERLTKAENESALAALDDKLETLEVFMDGPRTVSELVAAIEKLFSSPGAVTLASVHKSKGLEFDHVFFLDPELIPSRHAKKPWQQAQETNLAYVGVTRSKQSLKYISSKGWVE